MTIPEPAEVHLPAPHESEAAAEPAMPDDEATYQAILAAVMETARGRWFLAEYARRNRAADTQLVLQALARLEARVTERNGEADPAPGPAAEPARFRPDSASGASAGEPASQAAPIAEGEGAPDERSEPGSPIPPPAAEARPATNTSQEAPAPKQQLTAVSEQPGETEEAEADVPPAARRLAQLSRWERQALFS